MVICPHGAALATECPTCAGAAPLCRACGDTPGTCACLKEAPIPCCECCPARIVSAGELEALREVAEAARPALDDYIGMSRREHARLTAAIEALRTIAGTTEGGSHVKHRP